MEATVTTFRNQIHRREGELEGGKKDNRAWEGFFGVTGGGQETAPYGGGL